MISPISFAGLTGFNNPVSPAKLARFFPLRIATIQQGNWHEQAGQFVNFFRKPKQFEVKFNSSHKGKAVGTSELVCSRLIAITLAKSGTHLLYKTLGGLGLSPAYPIPYEYHQGSQILEGSLEESWLWPLYTEIRDQLAALQPGSNCFIQGHLPYNQSNANLLDTLGYSRIVMLRDPRAVAVSFMFHVLNTDHPLRPYFLSLPDNDTRLLASIQGVTPAQTGHRNIFLKDVGQRFKVIAGWLPFPNTLPIHFEDLVGPQGGGGRYRQIDSLERLARFLQLEFTSGQLEELAGRVFDTTSVTFRSGQIDEWRKHCKAQHVAALKETASQV